MFNFPWSNFHELNLDWILKTVKEAQDVYLKGEGDIKHAVETAEQALETAEQAAQAEVGDGAVTIAKLNNEVIQMLAYIVPGSVAPVFIPAGHFVIVRKSTIAGIADGIYIADHDINQDDVLTAADLVNPQLLQDGGGLNYILDIIDTALTNQQTSIDAIASGLMVIVDGDDASSAILPGGLAYIKNNQNGLAEGFYSNITNNTYPTTGGIADIHTFGSVSDILDTFRLSISSQGTRLVSVETISGEAKNAIINLTDVLRDFVFTYANATVPANGSLTVYANNQGSYPASYYILGVMKIVTGNANVVPRGFDIATRELNLRNLTGSDQAVTPSLVVRCADKSVLSSFFS